MDEIWKDILGYEGKYKISNLGKIFSVKKLGSGGDRTGRIMKLKIDKNGYCYINLFNAAKRRTFKIHRLVALHFISNGDNKPQVNHIDFDRKNNRVDNLEWCTSSENHKHTWINGRGYNPLHEKGLSNPNTKYHLDIIKEMILLRDNKMSYPKIANKFGCSHSTVQRLIKQHRQMI